MDPENLTILVKSINWYLDRQKEFNEQVFQQWMGNHTEITNELKTLSKKETLRIRDLIGIIVATIEGLIKEGKEINGFIKKFLSRYEDFAYNEALEGLKNQISPAAASQALIIQPTTQQGTSLATVTKEKYISPAIGAQLNIEPFSGPDDDVELWFKNFERQANAYFWNEEIKLAKLPIYLKESALSTFENIQEGKRFEEVKNTLLEEFKSDKNYLDEFVNCKQKTSEKVILFASRLKDLGKKALKGECKEKDLIYRFMKGVHREIYKMVCTFEGENFETLIKRAKTAEQCLESEKESEKIEISAINSYKKQEQGRESRQRESIREPRYRETSKSPTRKNIYERSPTPLRDNFNCYKCGRPGHIAKKCPENSRITCHICNKPGHKANDCYFNNKNSKNSYQPVKRG